MCGTTCASSAVDHARPLPQALGADAVLDAALEHDLHAHADAEHRATAGEAAVDDLVAADRAQPVHARRRRRRRRDHEAVAPAAARASAVSSTRAPARSGPARRSARCRSRSRARRRGAERTGPRYSRPRRSPDDRRPRPAGARPPRAGASPSTGTSRRSSRPSEVVRRARRPSRGPRAPGGRAESTRPGGRSPALTGGPPRRGDLPARRSSRITGTA